MVINGSKTTKTGNRDTGQHRKYVKDLVNLLFCVDSTEFASIITEKPYPKYQFQSHQVERKLDSKTNNRVQNSINPSPPLPETLESLYEHYTHLKTFTKVYCTFCLKQDRKPSKKRDLELGDFFISKF